MHLKWLYHRELFLATLIEGTLIEGTLIGGQHLGSVAVFQGLSIEILFTMGRLVCASEIFAKIRPLANSAS